MDAPLAACTCLACRAQVWYWPGGRMADGKPLTFDLLEGDGNRILFVHDCEEGDGGWDEDWETVAGDEEWDPREVPER
jgi:hypothetical protein